MIGLELLPRLTSFRLGLEIGLNFWFPLPLGKLRLLDALRTARNRLRAACTRHAHVRRIGPAEHIRPGDNERTHGVLHLGELFLALFVFGQADAAVGVCVVRRNDLFVVFFEEWLLEDLLGF